MTFEETATEDWTAIPAREAVDILTSFFGSAPIHKSLAKRWLEESILRREIFVSAERVEFHDLDAESLEPFQVETEFVTRHHIVGGADKYHWLRKYDGPIEETTSLEMRWVRGDTATIDREYTVTRGDDVRLCRARSNNIHVYKEEIIWWLGGAGGKRLPEEQPISPIPQGRPKGRPRTYDWDSALIYMIGVANHPDGLPTRSQAEIERMLLEWFAANGTEEPAMSTIRPYAQRIKDEINKNN